MMTIEDIVSALKTNRVRRPDMPGDEWVPTIIHVSSLSSDSASDNECDAASGGHCPSDLKQFWRLTRTATLFEDIVHRHWGMEIFSPDKSIEETKAFRLDRPADMAEGDLVIGRLIGDSDRLLIRTNPADSDFGSVIIAGSIDPRQEWETIAGSFVEFLNRYIEARGEMFWAHSK